MVRPATYLMTSTLMWLCFSSQAQDNVADQRVDRYANTNWHTLTQCPALVERVVPIPALESGVLQELAVELNSAVAKDSVVAKLDSELADMNHALAKLQYSNAKRLADDNSDVDFQQIALQEVEEEYANHQELGRNISETELRRLKLAVGKAKLALVRAQQAKAMAIVEAQLKYANISAAELKRARRTVHAPFAGIISKLICQPGQWVEAGDPIVEIKDMHQLMVDRLIPYESVNLSTLVGSDVRIRVDTTGQVGFTPNERKSQFLNGTVTSYDPEVTARGLVRIHTRVQNRQRDGRWLLLPGMNVDMLIEARHMRKLESQVSQAKQLPYSNTTPRTVR